MKKTWMIVLMLNGILLTGCQINRMDQPSGVGNDVAALAETETAEEEGRCLEPIAQDSISQAVYDDLQDEWTRWNSQSTEQKMRSSHFPGICQRGFDDWAECETYLGFPVRNPLEECSWLEKGTCVAMPAGFMSAPHIQASWYGTADGHVEWIRVEAGYRNGEVRVVATATLYGDPADIKSTDSGWTIEFERLDYLDGLDSSLLQVTSEKTERYFSNMAYRAQGPVLYCFNIVGEPDAQEQVEDTLEQVLDAFWPATN